MKDEEDFSNFLTSRTINSYHREATVERDDLIKFYMSTHYKELVEEHSEKELNDRLNNNEYHSVKLEVNSLMQSCIDDNEDKFIQFEDKNKLHIFLTPKGKRFGSIGGLIKAEGRELGEILKEWRLTLVLVVSLLGAFNTDSIREWFIQLIN